MQLAGSHECGSARAERDADCRICRAIITADDRGRSSRLGRHAEARRGSPVVRLYIGMRRIGTSAEASGPQLRNAREASARDAARAAPTRRGPPTSAIRWRRASCGGWRESSKRSSASVGAGARFRGEPVVRCPTEAIAGRPTSTSRGSTCASSGPCSRRPARGTTAECVAKEWRAVRKAGDCSPRTAHADGRAPTVDPGPPGKPTRGEAIARGSGSPRAARLAHRRGEAAVPRPPRDK